MRDEKMSTKHPILTITGDICIDQLRFPVKPKDLGLNWKLHPEIRTVVKTGGALRLTEFVRGLTDAVVISPELDVAATYSEKVLRSNVDLNLFPFSSDPTEKNKSVYRVRNFHSDQ